MTHESREADRDRELAARDAALRNVDFLDALPESDHRWLAARTEHRLYAAGETVVRQDDESRELYIIERGEVSVLVERTAQSAPRCREVLRRDGLHDR